MSADIVDALRERAKAAKEERTGTADGDAYHFERAADEIERLRERLGDLLADVCSHAAIDEAMQDAWNDICTDTGCHPLDIEHGRGKQLTFKPNHWANQVAKRLFVRALRRRLETLPAALTHPAPAAPKLGDPHPHWSAETKNENYPKTVEEWDPRKDPVGQHLTRAVARLRISIDRDDPRAPDEMALVSRWDLMTLIYDWWHKCAVFDIWRAERDKAKATAAQQNEPVAWREEQMGPPLYAAPSTPSTPPGMREAFQARVHPWLMACFGPDISADKIERNYRFIEEALELVQACGCTQSDAHQLVDYVYGRPDGDINHEVGGVMVTLAALCLANGFDMHAAGETELVRIWGKIEAIRAKQAAKPRHSPLPGIPPSPEPAASPEDDRHG